MLTKMAQIAWKQFKMNCENSAAWARAMDEFDAEIKASYNLQAYGWNFTVNGVQNGDYGFGFCYNNTQLYNHVANIITNLTLGVAPVQFYYLVEN